MGGARAIRGGSALAVLLAAVGFDVLAEESSAHVLAVAVAAGSLGALRLALRRRVTGAFALLNLVVLVQPAAHALSTLTPLLSTSSAVALQVAITLVLVFVAASEPLLGFVATAPRALLLARPPTPTGPGTARPVAERGPEPTDLGLVRCLPRRGPPVPAGA